MKRWPHPADRRAGQRGAAALEFALVAIPLLTLLSGITELGRALYYYNTLAKSTRDAARLMSTQTPTDPDYAALTTRATCTAVYGNSACTGNPLLPGLTTAMVSMCDRASCPATHAAVPTGTGVINLVTVTVGAASAYAFQAIVPFFAPSLFNFNAISVTMRQSL